MRNFYLISFHVHLNFQRNVRKFTNRANKLLFGEPSIVCQFLNIRLPRFWNTEQIYSVRSNRKFLEHRYCLNCFSSDAIFCIKLAEILPQINSRITFGVSKDENQVPLSLDFMSKFIFIGFLCFFRSISLHCSNGEKVVGKITHLFSQIFFVELRVTFKASF